MAARNPSKSAKAASATGHRHLTPGDWVEIRYSGGQRGRVIEYRGPLGPNGADVYRIRLGRKPRPTYVELPEDQLESIPAKPRKALKDQNSGSI